MAASAIEKQPSGLITLLTEDGSELLVDKELLCSSSKFFAGMLTTCDTTRLHVEENREVMESVLTVMRGSPPANTFDTRSTACWAIFKKILVVADKYDMSLVKERCEKWLVSRCLRGRMRSQSFKFQDVGEGFEWLAICQKFDLKDLGWYCAYDLGTQLAQGAWSRPLHECLEGVTCADMLKTILEAVQAAVLCSGPLGGVSSGATMGADPGMPGLGPE
ncbi:hypothetical protein VOLCADRAFT_92387 [Volvox carteri f. nagariensis]|uniref:BTB domain-containing protein n=1 Tax=Volvox carteri f. nagariensis TaxID=3068 RepID=D8TZJ0_VOLCA|nr:uncharacterized protein VOLCADRAFT_92387 [Volvox carteri f. nagariensis]EFJ47191.1 hypothetical protein VOLCADRAFT_92387 [Volvox carteri f. nagariensis]|eukprot:XP_002951740.1 hypothetical protein VOLCADRAFT_92387 [Volvox carteri f. nagariensis]